MDIKNQILQIGKEKSREFFQKVKDISYEPKGILTSEMFLFAIGVIYTKATHIIESGRARGQSTKILASYFDKDCYHIDSIDFRRFSWDEIIARKRLKEFSNIRLHTGDSFHVIPRLIGVDPVVILIDGPKGKEALRLALKVLENPSVKVVGIHDFYKESLLRQEMEHLFPRAFYSDDKDFVKLFSFLDNKAWGKIQHIKGYKYSAPFVRNGVKTGSYFATLGLIINN